jgi:hypothetical protein
MTNEHEIREVTAADWYRCGFKDGQHGNVKFPPRVGHSTSKQKSRDEYLRGYADGKNAA